MGVTDLEARRITYTGFYDTESRSVRGVIPNEAVITLHVNGQALVRLVCTPAALKDLALGFLFNERVIDTLDDVAIVELCSGGDGVDVWLAHDIELSSIRSITSGCSGGVTFEDVQTLQHQVASDLRVRPEQVTDWMGQLSEEASLYRRAGGVHTSALVSPDEGVVCVAEDVGRHNTLDKIAGECLRRKRSGRDGLLLTSGRVSSEMVSKSARMGIPVVASRTSPTALAVDLAERWGMTLIGYTRRRSFRLYTGEDRLVARD